MGRGSFGQGLIGFRYGGGASQCRGQLHYLLALDQLLDAGRRVAHARLGAIAHRRHRAAHLVPHANHPLRRTGLVTHDSRRATRRRHDTGRRAARLLIATRRLAAAAALLAAAAALRLLQLDEPFAQLQLQSQDAREVHVGWVLKDAVADGGGGAEAVWRDGDDSHEEGSCVEAAEDAAQHGPLRTPQIRHVPLRLRRCHVPRGHRQAVGSRALGRATRHAARRAAAAASRLGVVTVAALAFVAPVAERRAAATADRGVGIPRLLAERGTEELAAALALDLA